MAVCSCSQSQDIDAVYTLSVDKTTIEADGRDMATFTIKDASGNVMTVYENMGKIYFKEVKTGQNLPRRSEGFTSIVNGEYEFVATCMGVQTVNTVKIKVQNRRNYELYHRNVGLFKSTSVWCSACPTLSKTLHNLGEDASGHSVLLCCHGDYENRDPFSINDLGKTLQNAFNVSGWPTLVYDLSVAKTGAGATRSELEEEIMKRRLESPATCGIRINSSSISGNQISVSVSVKASAPGSFDATCAIVADQIKYESANAYSVDGKGIYSDVVLAIQSNFLSYSSETASTLAKEGEMTKEFVFEIAQGIELPEEGIKVVAFAHRKTDDGSVMDNIISVPLGETSEYILNE